MAQLSWQQNTTKPVLWKRFGVAVGVGLPLVTGLLWMTQPDWRSHLKTVLQQRSSTLEAPYRYAFYDSLPANRNPAIAIQREIAFYQEQVRAQPDRGLSQAALAITYLRMARTTGEDSWYLLAEQAAQRSLKVLPVGNEDAIAVLARVAEARHDFAGALQLATQIPDSRDALSIQTTANLAMGKFDAAAQAATALVDRTLSMNAFTLQALVQVAQGKDKEALQSFQYALAVEEAGEMGNSARVRTLLGRFYYEQGQLQKAGDLYREALAILPDAPLALLNLAQLEIRQGNYDAAHRYYDRITAATSTNNVFEPLVIRGRARIHHLKGDRDRAEILWQQSETRLRQEFATTGNTFGHRRDLAIILLERSNPQDIAEAVTLMQTEVKKRRDADTLEIYAWALSRAGRLAEAQKTIQAAIAQGVRDAAVFDRASAIAEALGNAQANQYRQQVKAIDPTFGDKARQALHLGAGLGL